MNVLTAFSHEELEQEVFVLPIEKPGISLGHVGALKLPKELYGLREAPRLWFEKWT